MKTKQPSNDLVRLLSIIPRDRGAFFGSVVQYFFWHVYPIFTIIMLGAITQQFESGTLDGLIDIMYIYVGGMVVIHLINYITRNIGRTHLHSMYHKVLHNIYMEKFVYLDTNEIERIGTGRCISIIEKGFKSWSSFIGMGIEKVLSLSITLVYFIRLLRSMGVRYVVSFILILFGVMYISYMLNTYVVEARHARVISQNEYSKSLIRIIMSKVEMMQSRNKPFEMEKLDRTQDACIQANVNMNPHIHWMFFAPQLALDIVRICVFIIIGISYFQGDISTIATFVTLGAAFILLDSVLDSYLTFFKDVTKEFDVVKRLRRLFDEHQPERPYDIGSTYVYKTGNIHIENINFGYDGKKLNQENSGHNTNDGIFHNFSLSIPGAKKIALVGPSGSGKSTLVKLIAGYLRPDGGDIIVDGQKLKSISMESYYSYIGYLTQEPSVFDGSVRENLEYGMTNIYSQKDSGEAIEEAIRNARCEFIYDLPNGLDTQIGERGVRLSGGQKQRLAIAKIFLKNPKIILLDEPTSALDSESEEAVTVAMNTLFIGRTVIIIAHRLQTVKHADNIIYIEKGAVVESGTHEELMKLEGKYFRMVELQSGF